jgi:hypothetical protein
MNPERRNDLVYEFPRCGKIPAVRAADRQAIDGSVLSRTGQVSSRGDRLRFFGG